MSVCCECCVLSGRGLCDELITRTEESYRLWRVVVCDLETSKTRRLKPATGLWKVQPQWVVTPGKQTTKEYHFKMWILKLCCPAYEQPRIIHLCSCPIPCSLLQWQSPTTRFTSTKHVSAETWSVTTGRNRTVPFAGRDQAI